jgi:hypothetical protein
MTNVTLSVMIVSFIRLKTINEFTKTHNPTSSYPDSLPCFIVLIPAQWTPLV